MFETLYGHCHCSIGILLLRQDKHNNYTDWPSPRWHKNQEASTKKWELQLIDAVKQHYVFLNFTFRLCCQGTARSVHQFFQSFLLKWNCRTMLSSDAFHVNPPFWKKIWKSENFLTYMRVWPNKKWFWIHPQIWIG